jgi:hypothetical protein
MLEKIARQHSLLAQQSKIMPKKPPPPLDDMHPCCTLHAARCFEARRQPLTLAARHD